MITKLNVYGGSMCGCKVNKQSVSCTCTKPIKIDFTKPCSTVGGKKVRILCTDGPDPRYPVVGIIGKYVFGLSYNNALMNLQEANLDKTMYINLYPDTLCHRTREQADIVGKGRSRVACIKVTYKEGQFDD